MEIEDGFSRARDREKNLSEKCQAPIVATHDEIRAGRDGTVVVQGSSGDGALGLNSAPSKAASATPSFRKSRPSLIVPQTRFSTSSRFEGLSSSNVREAKLRKLDKQGGMSLKEYRGWEILVEVKA